MTLKMPATLEAYFEAANSRDSDALIACFAPDAVVVDENDQYVGRTAIRAWKEESFAKYSPVQDPRSCEVEGSTISVISTVSGNFPGSPVDLLHEFTLSEEEIARMVITLA